MGKDLYELITGNSNFYETLFELMREVADEVLEREVMNLIEEKVEEVTDSFFNMGRSLDEILNSTFRTRQT